MTLKTYKFVVSSLQLWRRNLERHLLTTETLPSATSSSLVTTLPQTSRSFKKLATMSTIFQTCRNLPTPLICIDISETRKSRVGYLFAELTGSKLAKVWALESLRYGIRPPAWPMFSLNWCSSAAIFITQVTMLCVLFRQ